MQDKISKLEKCIRRELSLKFAQIQSKETSIGLELSLNTSQGDKTLIITKYLLTDRDSCDLENYVVSILAQFDNCDKLELTKQSFDDFYKS